MVLYILLWLNEVSILVGWSISVGWRTVSVYDAVYFIIIEWSIYPRRLKYQCWLTYCIPQNCYFLQVQYNWIWQWDTFIFCQKFIFSKIWVPPFLPPFFPFFSANFSSLLPFIFIFPPFWKFFISPPEGGGQTTKYIPLIGHPSDQSPQGRGYMGGGGTTQFLPGMWIRNQFDPYSFASLRNSTIKSIDISCALFGLGCVKWKKDIVDEIKYSLLVFSINPNLCSVSFFSFASGFGPRQKKNTDPDVDLDQGRTESGKFLLELVANFDEKNHPTS